MIRIEIAIPRFLFTTEGSVSFRNAVGNPIICMHVDYGNIRSLLIQGTVVVYMFIHTPPPPFR